MLTIGAKICSLTAVDCHSYRNSQNSSTLQALWESNSVNLFVYSINSLLNSFIKGDRSWDLAQVFQLSYCYLEDNYK